MPRSPSRTPSTRLAAGAPRPRDATAIHDLLEHANAFATLVARASAENTRLLGDVATRDARIIELEQQLGHCREHLDSHRAQVAQLNTRLVAAETEQRRLKDDAGRAAQASQERLDAADRDLNTACAHLEDAQTQIRALETKVASRDDRLARIAADARAARSHLLALPQTFAGLEQHLTLPTWTPPSKSANLASSFSSAIHYISEVVSCCASELNILRDRADGDRTQHLELRQHAQNLEAQIAHLQQALATAETATKEAMRRGDALETQLATAHSEAAALQAQATHAQDRLRAVEHQAQRDIEAAQALTSRHAADLETCKSLLARERAATQSHLDEIPELRAQLAHARAALDVERKLAQEEREKAARLAIQNRSMVAELGVLAPTSKQLNDDKPNSIETTLQRLHERLSQARTPGKAI